MLYKNIELNCTEEELKTFIDEIEIKYEVRGFNEPYNGVVVENETGDNEAKYYILDINGRRFLQPHHPFKDGFVAIKDTEESTISGVIQEHVSAVIDELVIEKFKKVTTPETEIEALKNVIDELILNGGIM